MLEEKEIDKQILQSTKTQTQTNEISNVNSKNLESKNIENNQIQINIQEGININSNSKDFYNKKKDIRKKLYKK